jgi:radical SAM protein with 4Fe4S-binding SPASM domain
MKNIRDLSSGPSQFIIDICGLCNLKCPLCPQGVGVSGHDQPVRYMSFTNFKTIFRRIKQRAKYISLHNWSEPFLHPEMPSIIKLINEEAPDAFLHISSNGVILNKDRIEKLSGLKIDWLEITISGLTQDVYEKYHKNGRLSRVIANIGLLIDSKEISIKKLSIKYLQFEYNIVSYYSIRDELLRILQLKKFPAFVEINIVPAYVTASVAGYEKKYDMKFDEGEFIRTPMATSCNYPFEQLVIRSDGELFPCCVVPYDKQFSVGNILDIECTDFSKGEKYIEFRRSLIEGRNEVCNSCNLITRCDKGISIDRRLVKELNWMTNKVIGLKNMIVSRKSL